MLLYNQLLHCVRNDDVSFTRNKILLYTFQEEVQFPCKISGPRFTWFTCFDISNGLHYNVLSGLIIIIFSSTRSDGNLLTCKISSSLEPWLVRFVFSKEEDKNL